MATDEDLKLGDLLRYHMRDAEAAKGLLYRRLRCLANLENANKNLDKARAKNKDVATVRLFLSFSPFLCSFILCVDVLFFYYCIKHFE